MVTCVPDSGCVISDETRMRPSRVLHGLELPLPSRQVVVAGSIDRSIEDDGVVTRRNTTSQNGVSIAGSGIVRELPNVLTSTWFDATRVHVAGATGRTSTDWNWSGSN